MVSLYIDDPSAEDIRPTKDIDLTFQVTTFHQLEDLRQKLIMKGFEERPDFDVICRFAFEDLLVDVMSTQAVGWAPSNRWFEPGYNNAITISLEDVAIHVLPLPYFLASKMEAFFDRGIKDPYFSHDFEDIVYLFNYATKIASEILNVPDNAVKDYIIEGVRKILETQEIANAMPGHLYPDGADERFDIIVEKMKMIILT